MIEFVGASLWHNPGGLGTTQTNRTAAGPGSFDFKLAKDHPGVNCHTRSVKSLQRHSPGAPTAIQVADRFHLLQNLAEALAQAFGPHSQALKTVGATQSLSVTSPESRSCASVTTAADAQGNALPNSVGRGEKRTTNKSGNCTTKAGWLQCSSSGDWSHNSISLRTSTFPERQGRRDCGRSRLRTKDYVLQRWNDGCHDALRLFGRSKRVVILSSYDTVARYARRFRQAQGTTEKRRRSISNCRW